MSVFHVHLSGMKHLFVPLALSLALATSPVLAELPETTPPPADGTVDDGFSLIEEGAKLLFKGLMDQMEPALDDMGKALSELEPALKDLQPRMMELLALIDDVSNYQAPERLQNGDILIRRKPDAPAPPPLPDAKDAAPQTDL